ncbi:hypothetical protein RRG08_045138 [Elysia crispata]|uniref:ATP-dependent DNA helicase n=1 Tax=Elysia crispata TaxID=231223 RepID=A0AAE0YUS2_9GAST|nr:hypothetical protein RRG08_045138 [Elysia crispata]
MRVGNDGQFQQWLLRIGNGTEEVHNDIGEMAIQIPTELCQPDTEALITLVYNDFNESYTKEEYLSQRAILTTTHENVDHINDKMIQKLTSATEHTYNSADSIARGDADQNLYPTEFLNNQNPTGLLPHQLKKN